VATAIRVGKISAVDHGAGMVRVTYGERDAEVTPFIPMMADEYNMPAVDMQVVVLHLSSGGAVVLGRAWSEKNRPPEGTAGIFRKDLGNVPGQAVIRYDGNTLSIRCTGNIEVTAGGAITVNGQTIALN